MYISDDFAFGLFVFVIVIGLILGLPYACYRYEVWRSPCTEVMINGKIEYRGKSAFYKTESRGTATIYQEYEPVFWFPRMTKEIISDRVSVNPTRCDK